MNLEALHRAINRETDPQKRAHLIGALCDIVNEYMHANHKHPGFPTQHHGYAVILEELDEAWQEIKDDNEPAPEIIQVGASAVRFLVDTCF